MEKLYSFRGLEAVGSVVDAGMASLGWQRVDNPSAADAVFTYFSNAMQLEDAYFEDDGLIKLMKAGALSIDLSPASPTFARELSAIAAVNDLRPVEAPLVVKNMLDADAFGSRENLKCFVAGEKADYEEALPLLEAIVSTVAVTGGFGSAQLAKAAVTLQQAAQMLSAIEAEALFRIVREEATSVDRLEGSPEPQTDLGAAALAAIAEDSFKGSFTVEVFMGEVAAVISAADDVELILPQLEAVMHLLEILAVIGGVDMTPASLSLLYRDDADCAAHGLDWSRAEEFFPNPAQGYGDGYDDYDYGYDDDYPDDQSGYNGGFGGYSAN